MRHILNRLRGVVLKVVVHSWLLPTRRRPTIMRWCGIDVADDVLIMAGSRFLDPKVRIGNKAVINYGSVIDAQWAQITIEDHVSIAPQVTIMTMGHHIGPWWDRAGGGSIHGPVHIGAGSWIGLRSTILPNVTVGSGCMVAAGSVVVSDCEPNGLYAGVPARRIRDLDTELPHAVGLSFRSPELSVQPVQ